MTDSLEVVVDTPLVPGNWLGTPPNAITEERMTLTYLKNIVQLKYDGKTP